MKKSTVIIIAVGLVFSATGIGFYLARADRDYRAAPRPSPTPTADLRPPTSVHTIQWANGPVLDQSLRVIELGFRDDHIVVWRVQPTPTPAPPPPEAVNPAVPGPTDNQ